MSDIIPQRRCTKCNTPYPATAKFFYRCKANKSGLKTECKHCSKKQRNTQQKRYRAEHREQVNAWQRASYAANIEQRREDSKKKQAKESYKQMRSRYQATHRDMYNARNRARRAAIKSIGGKHTAKDIEAQFKRQKGKCYYCHKHLTKYHVDHVIPLSRGGSNDISNIVIACPVCNRYKSDKLPHEWPEGGKLL